MISEMAAEPRQRVVRRVGGTRSTDCAVQSLKLVTWSVLLLRTSQEGEWPGTSPRVRLRADGGHALRALWHCPAGPGARRQSSWQAGKLRGITVI